MSSVFIYLFLITSAIQYQLRHQRSKTASLSRKMSASISPICNVGKLIQSMFFPLLHMNHIVSCLQQHPQCGYIFFTSESIHLGLDNQLETKPSLINLFHVSPVHSVLTNMILKLASPRWMIICRSLRRDWLPFRFLIPVHIVINVARSVIQHAAPYTWVPFNTFSESIFPFLIK